MNACVLFRVDAGIQIGSGHVMRCLTLANALKSQGARCEFICREHPGNLIEYLRSKGYVVHSLPICHDVDTDLAHSAWLGSTQIQDANACAPILAKLNPKCLVVDHYALDARWERLMASHCGKLMVIDDLADRPHSCDALLDQTFGRNSMDYKLLVPGHCNVMCGSKFALLRPEFAEFRSHSLQRRAERQFKQVLVTMGGVDKDNVTCQALAALSTSSLPADCEITVVMGPTAPWMTDVKQQAKSMPVHTNVLVGVSEMAKLMAKVDLAIGAAGATSWERCCLGVPTIMIPLAENQVKSCQRLSDAGAGLMLSAATEMRVQLPQLIQKMIQEPAAMLAISEIARTITDGRGLERVLEAVDIK